MRKAVLCVFSLLLILLVFFTILSPKVEIEMLTLIESRTVKGTGRNVSIGLIAVCWGDDEEVLLNVVEGSGWESGLRLSVIPHEYYDRLPDNIQIGAGTKYRYVYSASRRPRAGDAVYAVATTTGEDTYLLVHPEALVKLDRLPSSMTLTAQAQRAALVDCRAGTFPFFEHSIWYTLYEDMGEELRVFSLHDVHQMTASLPYITAIVCALVCVPVLWCSLFALSGRRRLRFLAPLHTLLVALCLWAVYLLLGAFDLPASLMPPSSILDLSHYASEFATVTSAMRSLGDATVDGWLREAALSSALVAGVSLAALGALITVELCLMRRATRGADRTERL